MLKKQKGRGDNFKSVRETAISNSVNRALNDAEGRLYDIIAGTFIICGLTDDNFGSLNEEQAKIYLEKFRQPEVFIRVNDRIIAVKI